MSTADYHEVRKPADLAYVVSEYPATSHSFIRREVAALRARGLHIRTFSIRRASRLVAAADRLEAQTTTAIRPIRALDLLKSHLAAARHSPLGYLKTLRLAFALGARRPRATLWQLFYFAEAIVLWRHCYRERIHHLHSHFANSGSDVSRLATAFAKSTGSNWTWSFTMHGSAEFLDIKGFGLACKVRDADFVVCISDYCRAQLMWLVDSADWEKLFVVRCGVPIPPTQAVGSGRDGQLAWLNVLTVGRLIGLKGHTLLIAAGLLLRRRGLDVKIRIAGAGPLEAQLRTLAKAPGCDGMVTLLGALGEEALEEHYAWADVFCLPSMMEGLPIVLMEAMARGLPVVATQITAVGELVDDQRSGLLVRPGRADLIADALERLATEPHLRDQLSRGGKERVQTEFDIDESARRLEEILLRQGPGQRMPVSPVMEKAS